MTKNEAFHAARQKSEAIRRCGRAGEPVREIARSYNVRHSTISWLQPIFCVPVHQATAQPSKYFGAPRRPRKRDQTAAPPVFL
jgi:hypothetical protein